MFGWTSLLSGSVKGFRSMWVERAVQYGVLLLLSDDSAGGGVVFPLSFRPFREGFVRHGHRFLHLLPYLYLRPVAGPQFYFPAIGIDHVAQGMFPSIGDYFHHHQELLPGPGYEHGFFYNLVEGSQQVGERPTAAFPSSHVGMSTVLMIMAWRGSKTSVCLLVSFLSAACVGLRSISRHIT